MQILISSDVHGNTKKLKELISRYPSVDLHLNCGDIGQASDLIEPNQITAVKGNVDFFSKLPEERVIKIGKFKILLVHGHIEKVKQTMKYLIEKAKQKNVDICLFGHTHVIFKEMIDGILFINPGALGYEPYPYVMIEDEEVRFLTL